MTLSTDQVQETIAKSVVLHRNLHEEPPTVIHAAGLHLTLSDGRKIIDATGGAAVRSYTIHSKVDPTYFFLGIMHWPWRPTGSARYRSPDRESGLLPLDALCLQAGRRSCSCAHRFNRREDE